eukprot:3898851-Karenia_brevis.AAC.1
MEYARQSQMMMRMNSKTFVLPARAVAEPSSTSSTSTTDSKTYVLPSLAVAEPISSTFSTSTSDSKTYVLPAMA